MFITFTHAPNEFQERNRLWENIYRESLHYHFPWLCMGDFNEVLYHWEKVGKKRAENYRLTAFRDFLYKCSLLDLECKGCAFTRHWFRSHPNYSFDKPSKEKKGEEL